MVFLALAVACSTAIAALFKRTEGRMDRVALLTVNYLVATLVAAARVATEGAVGAVSAPLVGLGVGVGVLFIAGFAVFSLAIGTAGMSLATATMRLSVAIPFAASWLVWGETPSAAQGAGLAAAAAAFVLITRRPAAETVADVVPIEGGAGPRRGGGTEGEGWPGGGGVPAGGGGLRAAGVLALLFLAGGAGDTAMKVFEEELAPTQSRPLFLLVVFGVAFAVGTAVVAWRRWRSGRWPSRAVWGWGAALGAANYGSAEFILLALSALPGTFVFPANSVSIVALATLLGVVVWGERLSRANWGGLALAAVALVLLTG